LPEARRKWLNVKNFTSDFWKKFYHALAVVWLESKGAISIKSAYFLHVMGFFLTRVLMSASAITGLCYAVFG